MTVSAAICSAQTTNSNGDVILPPRAAAVVAPQATLGLSGPSGPSGAPSMIAWWPAEGDATDKAGNHTGTVENAVTFAPGEVNQAFTFNGTAQS